MSATTRIQASRSWFLAAVVLTLFFTTTTSVFGVPLVTSLRLAAVLVVQAVTGAALWALAKGGVRGSFFEFSGIGIALGSVLAMGSQQVLLSTNVGQVAWILPTLVAVVLVISFRKKLNHNLKPVEPRQWIALLLGLFAGLAVLAPNLLRTPLANGGLGGTNYHADLVFFEALAQSLTHFGARDDILLANQPIYYHWFAYAWNGQLTELSGAAPFQVLTRALPLILLIAAVTLGVAWASRLSRVSWVPSLAVLLLVAGSYVGAEQGVVLTYDSPSVGYASIVLLAFVLALLSMIRGKATSWALAVIAILGGATVGAKVSHALILGFTLAVLALGALAWPRSMRLRTWASVAVTVLAMGLVYKAVLSGVGTSGGLNIGSFDTKASSLQGLDPWGGATGALVGSVILSLAIAARWAGFGWYLRSRRALMQPVALLGLGMAVGGVGALFLFGSGVNDAWFPLGASCVLAILSAVGVGAALGRAGWVMRLKFSDPVLWSIVIGGINGLIVFAIFTYSDTNEAHVRWLAPLTAWLIAFVAALLIGRRAFPGTSSRRLAAYSLLAVILVCTSLTARLGGPLLWQKFLSPAGGIESPVTNDAPEVTRDPRLWTPEMGLAAAWVNSHVNETAILATDSPEDPAFVPAVTSRRMLVAGGVYPLGYSSAAGIADVPVRRALVSDYLRNPNPDSLAALQDAGVSFVWLSDPATDLSRLPSPVFRNSEVSILDIRAGN